MPSSLAILDHLQAKPLRAFQLIRQLDYEITTFFAANPFRVSYKDDRSSKTRTYFVQFTEDIPLEFAAIIGDVLHELRSSLDHLAHHLVCQGKGSKGPFSHVYFPIFKSAKLYKAGKGKKIDGMKPMTIKAIDDLEPYYGGNGRVLFDIHELNIVDKHRLLLPVWMSMTAHTSPRSQRQHLETILRDTFPHGLPPNMLRAAPGPVFPKSGDPILTLPIDEAEDTMRFRFQLAFGEHTVRGKVVVPTLENMANVVIEVMENFGLMGLL